METSAGAPICSVPSLSTLPMTLAGLIVAMATTCSKLKPMLRNLLITQGKNGRLGELPL